MGGSAGGDSSVDVDADTHRYEFEISAKSIGEGSSDDAGQANFESEGFAACGNFREKVAEGQKSPRIVPISASSDLGLVSDFNLFGAINPGL